MKPDVWIVEDNFLLALELAEVVQTELDAVPVILSKVSEALELLPNSDNIAVALLDIEVADGQSFPVARQLMKIGIPFIFVSGNNPASLPEDLKTAPFLSKPAPKDELVKLIKPLVTRSGRKLCQRLQRQP